ncbi:MAG: hypothetical protein BWY80_01148 [Firmicutes bacterium ADurb.Bin456]|nr:MAG: hypothetical protein BWY80_01148 [Firmicutes bacterium ADurb.Bin456]
MVRSLMIRGFTLGLPASMGVIFPLIIALLCPIHSSMRVVPSDTVAFRVSFSQPTSAPRGVAANLMGSKVRSSIMAGLTSMIWGAPLTV